MVQDEFAGDSHVLECSHVSFVKSVRVGKWYMRLYNPPLNAQFLEDISLTVHAGELHGITGTAGSGKTTLLNVIAARYSGELSGHITLNEQPLSGDHFNALCAYVSFEQRLLPCLTVKSMLNFYANLTICGLDSKDKEERILSLMQEFELLSCGHERIQSLEESARRRLIVCMYLLRDPILVLLDEPTKDMEPLYGYQLMSSLGNYMKRNQRMAIVAMRCPRSDLYQLMTRITILFYGESLYSGYTKQMPLYFRQAGYPCPSNENPAVYYLSLATIDRETSERYHETQQQAIKLIETFKQLGIPLQGRPPIIEPIYPAVPQRPLCALGTPNPFTKLLTLTRRSYSVIISSWASLLTRFLLIPLCAFCISFYGIRFPHQSLYVPMSLAAIFFNCQLLFSIAALFTVASCYTTLRHQMAREVEEGLVSGALGLVCFLIACFPLDLLSVLASAFIVVWSCNLSSGLASYFEISFLIWCCYQTSSLVTVLCMTIIRSSYRALFTSLSVCLFSLAYAGAFLRAPRSLAMISSWIHYGTYASVFRYVSSALNSEFVTRVNAANCTRTEHTDIDTTSSTQFCRWKNGVVYLEEIYSDDSDYASVTFNFIGCLIHVLVLSVIVLVCYSYAIIGCRTNKFKRK
uniref:ATP-binding cassette sub-family G member 5 n=1 Tax=Toxocara canis TaxID=6265 RepID=A0A1L2JQJ6_TOXCA|nr:ATP-binding cassette sub-family G member 5 [Toxocara canis]